MSKLRQVVTRIGLAVFTAWWCYVLLLHIGYTLFGAKTSATVEAVTPARRGTLISVVYGVDGATIRTSFKPRSFAKEIYQKGNRISILYFRSRPQSIVLNSADRYLWLAISGAVIGLLWLAHFGILPPAPCR